MLVYKVSESQRIYVIHSNIPTKPSIVNAMLNIRKCLYVMNTCTTVILHTQRHCKRICWPSRRMTGRNSDWKAEFCILM